MWVQESVNKLPRTKTTFTLTSVNGDILFIKPGSAYNYYKEGKSFVKTKNLSAIKRQAGQVVISPSGNSSLHLLKQAPFLAFHHNQGDPIVTLLPVPRILHNKIAKENFAAMELLKADGKSALMTLDGLELPSNPFANFFSKATDANFSSEVQGLSVSEDGHAIALALESQLWVWSQNTENCLGVGEWTDLSLNQRFKVGTRSNHPDTKYINMKHHGFHKPKQSFTLIPALAANVPQNMAVSYQDLATFSNPDEGIGVCCLTVVLPPCRPYDTTQLYISICYLSKGPEPVFERASLQLPIEEGYGGPCIWWSVDCRFAVIAVSKSLVIVTRYLEIIKVLPLEEVFPGDEPLVASVAWSSGGEFFVTTSMQGSISAVTRDGKSLRHSLCALESFSDKVGPVIVAGDAKDPSLFVAYTEHKYRTFKMDLEIIPRSLKIYISLQFPQRTVKDYYDKAIAAIQENGSSDPYSLVNLIYLTDFFRIFPYQSPLRYLLFTMFNDGARLSLESENYAFTYFLIRCIFRVTDRDVDVYQEVMERLSYSDSKRDRLLYEILDDELNLRDYSTTESRISSRIKIMDLTNEENEDNIKKIKPANGLNVDLPPLIDFVKSVIYNKDASQLNSIDCNLNLFLNVLIKLGLFDMAMKIATHSSITATTYQIFEKIVDLHSNSACNLYRGLIACISACPEKEDSMRAACVKAIVNIMKEKIGETFPKKGHHISEFVPYEDDFGLYVPESIEQLSDFASIVGIGLCAADFPSCKNFYDHKEELIPDVLRESVRNLFGLLWFVQWRFTAVTETARLGKANDATLRLLAFPDFVNTELALRKIELVDRKEFSHQIYSLYVGGSRIFEDDPSFPDFAVDLSTKIDPKTLTRISKAVLQFGIDDAESIPHSNLLLAAIISHMIPWLRCGISRALAGYKVDNQEVPPELIDFEDFILKSAPPPEIKIEHKEIEDIQPEIPNVPDNDESSEPISNIRLKRKKRRPEPEPKRKRRKPAPKPKKVPEKPLRLLTVDKMGYAPVAPINPAPQPMPVPQYYPQYYPQPMYYPTQPTYYYDTKPTNPVFPSIWDFNPNNFENTEEEPPKKIEVPTEPPPPPTPPTRKPVIAKTQDINVPEKKPKKEPKKEVERKQPIIIMSTRHKREKELSDFDMSISEISDISFDEPKAPPRYNIDPFPQDDGLFKKVEMLLDDARGPKDNPSLPAKLKPYEPPPILDMPTPTFSNLDDIDIESHQKKTKKVVKKQVIRREIINDEPERINSVKFKPPLQNMKNNQRSNAQNENGNSAWKPKLSTGMTQGIISLKEIPANQFDEEPKKPNYRVLDEIDE